MRIKTLSLAAALLTGMTCSQAWAQFIDSSSLIGSTEYYTEMPGVLGGLGSVVNMTGGGSIAEGPVSGPRSDDGFSGPIALNFTSPLSFYGGSYSEFYINTNGSITFGDGLAAYTPDAWEPLGANRPIIAPFLADVDTRNPLSGVVYVNQATDNQTIVTWDSVGYYNQHATNPLTGLPQLNSFQLVIRGADYTVPADEGMVGFFWKTMSWETGDSSGGSGGFSTGGGTAAAIGFGDGSSSVLALDWSMMDGVAGVVENHHIWFNINNTNDEGLPEVAAPPPTSPVPEPGTYAMLLAGLGLLGFTARRRKHNA